MVIYQYGNSLNGPTDDLPWRLRMETGIKNIILLEIEHFSLNFQARSASNS